MLSEFEVPKPENGFNQIMLEQEEVFIDSIKVTLMLAADWSIPGSLKFCSRSLVFQPKSDTVPILKFKFADSIQMTCGKLNLQYIEKELGANYEEFLKNLRRVFKVGKSANLQTTPTKNALFLKTVCSLLKVKRMTVYPVAPIAPYSVEIFKCYFLFRLDGVFSSQTKNQMASIGVDDQKSSCTLFEKLFQKIQKCENEEILIEEILQEKFMASKAKTSISSKLSFMYPCKIIETFEKFYGTFIMKDDRRLKVKPLLNVTKNCARSFDCQDVKWMTLYEFYYKKTGIELFLFSSAQSILLDFGNEKTAEKIYQFLLEKCTELIDVRLNELTKIWNDNLMSNYDYLMYLNRLANRSFNDISRYPIFPWVISDFGSEEFQINFKTQYRDFTKPMHIQWKSREERSIELFDQISKDPVPVKKPFHCSQFSSNPGSIVYFYTRIVPLLITKLQSEAFGPTDRVFRGFETLWSQMQTGLIQFTEMIPEMYTVNKVDILKNKNRLDFGISSDGEEISDVNLPKWALSPQDFMFKMKAALESEYCSLHLHSWIDLVFGINTKGNNAMKQMNMYSEGCYKENWDLMNIKSKLKLQAYRTLIHQYGQVPFDLFSFSHPKKKIKAQISMNDSKKDKGDNIFSGYMVKLSSNVEVGKEPESESKQLGNSTDLFEKLNTMKQNLEESIQNTEENKNQINFQNEDSDEDWKNDFDFNDG